MKKIFFFIIICLISCEKIYTDECVINNKLYYRCFNEDSKLVAVGSKDEQGRKIGFWNYYSKKEKLSHISEYILLNGKEYKNRDYKLSESGDTIGGNYYKYMVNDTIYDDRTLRLIIGLQAPLNSNSEVYLLLPKNNKENIYVNPSVLNYDTIYSSSKNEYMISTFIKVEKDVTSMYNLKGMLVEKFLLDSVFRTRSLFLDEKIPVSYKKKKENYMGYIKG